MAYCGLHMQSARASAIQGRRALIGTQISTLAIISCSMPLNMSVSSLFIITSGDLCATCLTHHDPHCIVPTFENPILNVFQGKHRVSGVGIMRLAAKDLNRL